MVNLFQDKTQTMTEGEAKDIILEYAVEKMGQVISATHVHNELFKNNSFEEVEFLFEKMTLTVDKVADISINDYDSFIEATELTKIFLSQGGFKELEKKNLADKKREEEKELAEFEKTMIDLRLKKWQVKTFWPLFIFAVIGFGLGLYNFISSLSPEKNEVQQEQRIKEMESELSKLRTSISSQKIDDSLPVDKNQSDSLSNNGRN